MARTQAAADDEFDAVSAAPKPKASADALERLRDHVRTARDLELEIADRTASLNEQKQRLFRLLNDELPQMFSDLGLTSLTLEASGNMPEYEARAAPFYRANIAASWDDERRAAAFKWLRSNKLAELVRAEYEVSFGKDSDKKQKALRAFLKKENMEFAAHEHVPHNTLTAVVRRMFEAGQPVPLETLGATVGTVVSIKAVKQK